jgi:hypothetical protein
VPVILRNRLCAGTKTISDGVTGFTSWRAKATNRYGIMKEIFLENMHSWTGFSLFIAEGRTGLENFFFHSNSYSGAELARNYVIT